ncbi:hypothetical protein Tco_0066331 [Tanacetum coccineum]
MGTQVTSSSGSVLEEPEIQKLQMQAKIFKENSLNKLNALKSTTQLLEQQSILYRQAFAQLFGDSLRTFEFQLYQHMNNLATLLNAETLHEMDSKSALSVIKVQFERFINSDLLKPLDIYSRSFSSDREVKEIFRDYTTMTAETFKETIIQNMNSIEQCIIERASHEQELKMTLKKLSERQLQIQQCKVQEIEKKKLEAHYSFMAKIQEVLPAESSSTHTPLEQVQNHDESNVFANERRHSEQPESINDTYVLEKDDSNVTPDLSNICNNDNQVDQNAVECVDERAALANLIANLKLDVDENKKIQKQLKKSNATLTQELTECKSILAETSRTLGESNSIRDSCLVALQNKQTEFERYKAFNDRTVDYDKLEHKLNEALGLLAQKEIDIKEGLKVKACEISIVKEKHDELVKQSLLTKSHYEGLVRRNTRECDCLAQKLSDQTEFVLPKACVTSVSKVKWLGSNDMVHNYYLEKAKKSAQLQKDKEVNGKPSMIDPARLPNTANGCKPKPRNWQASMSSRVSNKDVHLGEHRKQKPFLKFNDLQCPTCKKCLYSANHDECVLEYLSRLDVKSHKTTKRYMPVEKSSASKKPERQIPTGHRWVPTGKLLNSCTGKVENEPTHGSNVDIPHIHACKQTLGLSAGTSFNGQKQQRIDITADALYNEKQENLRVWLLKFLISKKPVPEWFHKR